MKTIAKDLRREKKGNKTRTATEDCWEKSPGKAAGVGTSVTGRRKKKKPEMRHSPWTGGTRGKSILGYKTRGEAEAVRMETVDSQKRGAQ